MKLIETNRLILREYNSTDRENYHALRSTKVIWKYSSKEPVYDKDENEKLFNQIIAQYQTNPYQFNALILKENNAFVGEAGIISFNKSANRAVVGYNLLPDFWNNGYATEITKELVKYAFQELKSERVEALVFEGNIGSRRVLEKAGLVLEGVLRNFTYKDSIYQNVCYYGMISRDFYDK